MSRDTGGMRPLPRRRKVSSVIPTLLLAGLGVTLAVRLKTGGHHAPPANAARRQEAPISRVAAAQRCPGRPR